MSDVSRASEISNIEAEAGVIATLLIHPQFVLNSDDLTPHHFMDQANGYIYYAISELAKIDAQEVDAYAITQILNMRKGCETAAESITADMINEAKATAANIARSSVEDYRVCVNAVLDAAFKRDAYIKLRECEQLCLSASSERVERQIYSTLDEVLAKFSYSNEIPQYKDVVDKYWEEIKARQSPETCGAIPFKFKTLNEYVMIERGELVIFGGEPKAGKSMLMLNCAVDLLRRGMRVLYLDSELNSRLFTCRMLSHLTHIPFQKIRGGGYSNEENALIDQQREWLKTRAFTHIYMPVFDAHTIYTTVKRVYYQQGIDVLIVDYFKGGDNPDAFATYQNLGGLCDEVKNRICGELNIAGIGAAQSNAAGRLADSAKIDRNASTIIMIKNKDAREIEADGRECGNKKLFVRFNRNGPQMLDEKEYIDMEFDGNTISYEEAKQHIPDVPY